MRPAGEFLLCSSFLHSLIPPAIHSFIPTFIHFPFGHSFGHAATHPFGPPLIHPFPVWSLIHHPSSHSFILIQSSIPSFPTVIQSFIPPSIHLFPHLVTFSFILPAIHLSISPFILSPFGHPFTHSSNHSFIPSFIHSFIPHAFIPQLLASALLCRVLYQVLGFIDKQGGPSPCLKTGVQFFLSPFSNYFSKVNVR